MECNNRWSDRNYELSSQWVKLGEWFLMYMLACQTFHLFFKLFLYFHILNHTTEINLLYYPYHFSKLFTYLCVKLTLYNSFFFGVLYDMVCYPKLCSSFPPISYHWFKYLVLLSNARSDPDISNPIWQCRVCILCLHTFSGLYGLYHIKNKCLTNGKLQIIKNFTMGGGQGMHPILHMQIKGKLPYLVSPSKILFLH